MIMQKYSSLYAQKELIGRGNYGKVYLVVSMKNFKIFVAKKIQLQGLTTQQIHSALQEVKIHSQLKHLNILEFKQFFQEQNNLIMIMQYCQFGDLSTYIKNRKQKGQYLEEPLVLNLFIQMLFGLNYLHQNKVMHRDIKTQNLFINSEGRIKLADFGISKIMQHTQQLAMSIVGTPYYLSPQACNNAGYTFKSDIWSLGCVLYQMCTLKHPFQGTNVLSLAKKISSDAPAQIPKNYSTEIADLIKWMLEKDPKNRPSTKQILDYKFLSKYLQKFVQYEKPRQNIKNSPNIKGKNKSNKYDIIETQTNLIAQNNSVVNYSPQQSVKNKLFSEQIQITPKKSGLAKLKQRCMQKMGQKLFKQIYDFMRKSKEQGLSQIQIQKQVKYHYNKTQFDLSMDVAQLIYIEDNN